MLVVYAHVIQPHTYLWNIITLFHMPLFYIISGYLNQMPGKDIKGMLIKRVIQLQIPYVVISMMVYLFTLVGNADRAFSFKSFVKYILMIDSPPILGAIWFIGTLFYSELLFGLLDSIFCRFSINDRIQGIVYIVLLVVGMFTQFPFGLSRIPVATAYLYIGNRIRNWDSVPKNSSFPRSTWLFVGGVILGVCGVFCHSSYSSNLYTNPIISAICALLGTLAVLELSKCIEGGKLLKRFRGNQVLAYLGKNSIGVVFFQFIAFRLVNVLIVMIKGLSYERILDFPVMYDCAPVWKLIYVIMALSVSIVLFMPVEKLSTSIKKRVC